MVSGFVIPIQISGAVSVFKGNFSNLLPKKAPTCLVDNAMRHVHFTPFPTGE
jgi:hypothetical protein